MHNQQIFSNSIWYKSLTWISSLVLSPSPRTSLSVSARNLILSSAWIKQQIISEQNFYQWCGRTDTKMHTYIRSIGNQLPQKDVLVTVERVDKDVHKTRDLSLELKLLRTSSESFPWHRLSFPKSRNNTVLNIEWTNETTVNRWNELKAVH